MDQRIDGQTQWASAWEITNQLTFKIRSKQGAEIVVDPECSAIVQVDEVKGKEAVVDEWKEELEGKKEVEGEGD